MNEFRAALGYLKIGKSPGLDGITSEMVLHLPQPVPEFILLLYNRMFPLSKFPESWGEAYVVPIPKPGGKGFRPISLTSVISKLFEKLVHRRLEHFMETHSLIPDQQYGFRK